MSLYRYRYKYNEIALVREAARAAQQGRRAAAHFSTHRRGEGERWVGEGRTQGGSQKKTNFITIMAHRFTSHNRIRICKNHSYRDNYV